MSESLDPRITNAEGNKVSFIVSPDGETTGEIAHLKQVKLEFARLTPDEPYAEIDIRRVAGGEIQVLFLDFGMPPRALTITGDFRKNNEVSSEKYDANEDSSPNTLRLRCPAYGFERDDRASTYYTTYGNSIENDVELRRGDYMGLTHDGEPSETRNGFIENDAFISLRDEYVEDGDYSNSSANLITVGYVDHALHLHTHDSGNAFVIYGRSVGFADRHSQPQADSEELEQLLGRLAHENSSDLVRELFGSLAVLATQHQDVTGQLETVEALLARNKQLLAKERRANLGLRRELEKERAASGNTDQRSEDWLNGIFEGNVGSGGGVSEACRILGLDLKILDYDPTLVSNMASMARKAWSKTLHPDIQSEAGRKVAEEKLKTMNNAADVIEAHFKIR